MNATIPASTLDKFSTFGDFLRYLRRHAGITQTELAIAVGYSTSQISRLEQNLRLPDLPILEARFVEALYLQEDSRAVARLLELAANVRREDAPSPGLCPYKGLHYFDESDADLFVGRETLTAKLAERVLKLASGGEAGEIRFLAVVGASGSGKSSLARAGLVPALRWNKRSTNWHIRVLTPTARPLESLAVSLAQESDSVVATAMLMDDLTADPRSLHLYASRTLGSGDGSRLLCVIDQFEEVFALCRSEADRSAFISNLVTAASKPDGSTVVVITLRADFYAHCASYPELREALAHHQEYIGAMNSGELRRAIEEPARRGHWGLEGGLVDLLLHDVGREPGALPLLSHALLETWERRRGTTMTLGGYAASGGVRGAIAETAESVFADLFDTPQQAIARRIFLRLTELGDETAGGDTRRRATYDELILRPEDAVPTQSVLKALADARLIITNEESAEVAHEALIREWPTLRGWLEDNREGLRLHRNLTVAAQEWFAMERPADMLYRGARLAQAQDWAANRMDDLNTLEHEFLEASIQQRERDAQEREAQRQRELEAAQKLAAAERRAALRLRARAVILSAAFAVAIALAGIALFFERQSNRYALQAGASLATAQAESGIRATAQANAEASFARAESQRLAAEANTLLSQHGNSELIALLSIRSMNIQYTPQGDAALTGASTLDYPVRIFSGSKDGLLAVAYSPDGASVLTGCNDGTASLWDAKTGTELRGLIGHTAAVEAVAYSPDGHLVATGGMDATARIWDPRTGTELRQLADAASDVFSLKFSPDGMYLLTGNGDGVARLWNVETGQLIRKFTGHSDQIWAVAFSPDGKMVFTGSLDKTARLWDTDSGSPLRILAHPDSVASGAFSPDGRTLVTTSLGGVVYLWDVQTGRQLHALTGHVGEIWASAFSPDGKYVATGGNDGTTRLWDPQAGVELRQLTGHIALVTGVAFSPDGKDLLSGSFDGTARLWEVEPHPSLPQFAGDLGAVQGLAFSPDGNLILTGGDDGTMRLWNAQTGLEIRRFIGHRGTVTSVAFSPDGKRAVSGGLDSTVRLWNLATGEQIRAYLGHTLDVGEGSVAFSPDGRYILAGSSDKTALLWDVQGGQQVQAFVGGGGPVWSVAFSRDGKYAFIGYPDSILEFDVQTGLQTRKFDGSGGSLSISPDGKFMLSCGCGSDRAPKMWNLQTAQMVRSFTGNIGQVPAVAFSPDGKYVLSGGYDDTARVWDAVTGREVRRFTGHTGTVNAVEFSPDGERVLTGSSDGTIRLWNVDYHSMVRDLCARLLRDLSADERTQYDITDNSPTCYRP